MGFQFDAVERITPKDLWIIPECRVSEWRLQDLIWLVWELRLDSV